VEEGLCNSRAYVCLFICPIICPPLTAAAGFLLSTQLAEDIDLLLDGAHAAGAPCGRHQRLAANAGSAPLTADVGC